MSLFVFCFRALFTYEGNSNDIRVAGTGGEYGQMRKWMGYKSIRRWGGGRESCDISALSLLALTPSQQEEGHSGCRGIPCTWHDQ